MDNNPETTQKDKLALVAMVVEGLVYLVVVVSAVVWGVQYVMGMNPYPLPEAYVEVIVAIAVILVGWLAFCVWRRSRNTSS